ncbi:hypothetical protein B0T26DRAFT_527600 [Lasiosphaeria miniovina]|uniref:Uncharacterized protein n=1 Tax=Lasiosphaeria miniovina TaxID=1954250 RepID=A0AA40DJ05_9PEZI|nr:uncharacterized protein B0T26DRAFT_527600 [Lasiosphaeria miniovina]KAK0701688.1 hypothetical protein B0T26DRAFT_527600 [Lasiosphaeria miniovina]
MGRRQRLILSVLVGAHCAAALFEGFVDVKVIETIVRAAAAAPAPAPAPAETATALSTSIATASLGDDELGRQACSTAFGVVDKCSSEGFLAATADQASAANCFCCYSSTFLSNQYRRCASSIFYSAPGESEAYTTAAVLYSICSDVGRGICSAPTLPTAPPIVITQSSRARGTPSACLAILDIVFSCGSAIPNPQTADSEQLASCFCYTHGTYTTALETLASSCAPWASSQGGPGDYSCTRRHPFPSAIAELAASYR